MKTGWLGPAFGAVLTFAGADDCARTGAASATAIEQATMSLGFIEFLLYDAGMTRVHLLFIVGRGPAALCPPRGCARVACEAESISEAQRWLRVRGFIAHHAEYGQFVSTSFVVIGCRC
jgi:hypothetical protein